MLRYFNFERSFKLRWCCAQDLFGLQIPVVIGICDPKKSRARHHRNYYESLKIKYFFHNIKG